MSLADAILQSDLHQVRQMLRYENVNEVDKYGFRPLIEAAIVENIEISQLLLEQGANPKLQDATGGTALQWAVENNNIPLCKLLLEHGADPNAYNYAGQPILAMALLRNQSSLRKVLVKAGADITFAQDYINTKLLGHMFELVGKASIISPTNQFVEVDFEGFYLEITLGVVAEALEQFHQHFAARQLRRYSGLAHFIVEVMQHAAELIKYQQYRVNVAKHQTEINTLLSEDPVLIPVAYEGHAITFIKYGNIWVKCDRREDSRLYDNVMFYKITNQHHLTDGFIQNLIFKKQESDFINHYLDEILGLEPITELKVEAQISGNCSWANVEAAIPALFFLLLMQTNRDANAIAYHKTLALNFFHRWREWNKDRALQFCIQSYEQGDPIRRATKAEILVAVLFQCCNMRDAADRERIQLILSVIMGSPYEYLLKNYLKAYFYEDYTEEGKRFAEMLKEYAFKI